MDNEVARYVRRTVTGFSVSDADVNFELIRRVGIGGNYLSEPETAEQFREFLNLSPFFGVGSWGGGPTADESSTGCAWQRNGLDNCSPRDRAGPHAGPGQGRGRDRGRSRGQSSASRADVVGRGGTSDTEAGWVWGSGFNRSRDANVGGAVPAATVAGRESPPAT